MADFCEAVTGREFCVPSGRALQLDERVFAVLGMVAGNRMVWDEFGGQFRKQLLDRFRDPEGLQRGIERFASAAPDFDRRAVSYLIAGEVETQGGRTFIKSGMHTEDAVQSVVEQMRSEGRKLDLVKVTNLADLFAAQRAEGKVLRFEGANGVGLYLFPESSFVGKGWSRNNVDVIHQGKFVNIDGAKTVYPSSWGYGKMADSLVSVRNNPASLPSKSGLFGSFEGVDMRVGLDEAGKISKGTYPIVRLLP